ncbi:phosphoribosylamine--glycine ligase [Nitrosovibrio sp. Nv17]|jgi:phosphoribosylamine--glycine ligase|uniref:phosphoribosylamine--glycine ligase n=1 Tax=Nitrosovibrio sp. Nv17 TaxID=1855339 RepID=UPI0009086357|nr:phosphoribosylamine--glycine ligase [Nitrosovibrio sp. Nv17]SFW31521.1 phosphoribosylamine--glycine ligase [Nitrosovibrio sp. Nv17]
MKLLVIGGGGREHALAWKLLQSPRAARALKVFVAPGNAGTALEDGIENLPLSGIPELVEFARKESVAFTVVGPEAPLAAGIVDAFLAAGLRIFGPTRAAARLESSKAYAKDFMTRHGIPTAAHASFSAAAPAHDYLDKVGAPIVVKADGLAAGKGVVVARTPEEAHAVVDAMLAGGGSSHGEAAGIVIEEFLEGEEVSFIVMADGRHVLPLATSQDHKRLKEGDQGPNTGGMGAYSPAPVVTPMLHARIMREVIHATMAGLEHEGESYTGFLYAGLMVTPDGGVKVLEFNCRMGDPEAQVILMRLKSDLVELVEHAIDGTLDRIEAEWDRRTALGVVMAAQGYPEAPRKGDVIHGLPALLSAATPEKDFHVFHAGTADRGDGTGIVTAGGRVLCVAALGDSVRMAQRRAYDIAEQIHFGGCQMRRDIGYRAIGQKK